jgi:hypothetical protein
VKQIPDFFHHPILQPLSHSVNFLKGTNNSLNVLDNKMLTECRSLSPSCSHLSTPIVSHKSPSPDFFTTNIQSLNNSFVLYWRNLRLFSNIISLLSYDWVCFESKWLDGDRNQMNSIVRLKSSHGIAFKEFISNETEEINDHLTSSCLDLIVSTPCPEIFHPLNWGVRRPSSVEKIDDVETGNVFKKDEISDNDCNDISVHNNFIMEYGFKLKKQNVVDKLKERNLFSSKINVHQNCSESESLSLSPSSSLFPSFLHSSISDNNNIFSNSLFSPKDFDLFKSFFFSFDGVFQLLSKNLEIRSMDIILALYIDFCDYCKNVSSADKNSSFSSSSSSENSIRNCYKNLLISFDSFIYYFLLVLLYHSHISQVVEDFSVCWEIFDKSLTLSNEDVVKENEWWKKLKKARDETRIGFDGVGYGDGIAGENLGSERLMGMKSEVLETFKLSPQGTFLNNTSFGKSFSALNVYSLPSSFPFIVISQIGGEMDNANEGFSLKDRKKMFKEYEDLISFCWGMVTEGNIMNKISVKKEGKTDDLVEYEFLKRRKTMNVPIKKVSKHLKNDKNKRNRVEEENDELIAEGKELMKDIDSPFENKISDCDASPSDNINIHVSISQVPSSLSYIFSKSSSSSPSLCSSPDSLVSSLFCRRKRPKFGTKTQWLKSESIRLFCMINATGKGIHNPFPLPKRNGNEVVVDTKENFPLFRRLQYIISTSLNIPLVEKVLKRSIANVNRHVRLIITL